MGKMKIKEVRNDVPYNKPKMGYPPKYWKDTKEEHPEELTFDD